MQRGQCALAAAALFHSYALNFSVLSILATGASEYILEKYSTREAMRLLETGEFTVFPGVPTMFHYLMEAAQAEGRRHPSGPARLRLRRGHHAGDA